MVAMAPAKMRKLLYPILVISIALLFIAIDRGFGFHPAVGVGVAALFLIPGRLQGYVFREFFQGRRALALGQTEQAEGHFLRFLDQIQKRPSRKRLIWFAPGIYTADIEAMTYNNLGVVNLSLDRFGESEKWLRKALGVDPSYPLPHFSLGLLHLLSGSRRKASSSFQEAVRLGFEFSSVDHIFAKLTEALARVEGLPGLPQVEPRDEMDPTSSVESAPGKVSPLGKAYIFELMGLHEKASHYYEIACMSGNSTAKRMAAEYLLRQGRAEEAGRIVVRLTDQEPQSWENWSLASIQKALSGDFGESVKYAQKTLELVADKGTGHALLSEVHLSQDEFELAEKHARLSLELEPDNSTALAVLAHITLKAKDWKQALDLADRSLAQLETGWALEARARACAGLGQKSETDKAVADFIELVQTVRPLEVNLKARAAALALMSQDAPS